MATHRKSPRKLFTVQQANAALPLVRAIMSDLVSLSRDVSERRQRLSFLLDGRDAYGESDPYREELTQVEEDLEEDCRRLRGYADELLELGVEPKSAVEGLVDFPSMKDGRRVYLCWKLGEPEVLFWHEWHAGYAGRRPLAAETVAVGR
jgi:hypothetical protein